MTSINCYISNFNSSYHGIIKSVYGNTFPIFEKYNTFEMGFILSFERTVPFLRHFPPELFQVLVF